MAFFPSLLPNPLPPDVKRFFFFFSCLGLVVDLLQVISFLFFSLAPPQNTFFHLPAALSIRFAVNHLFSPPPFASALVDVSIQINISRSPSGFLGTPPPFRRNFPRARPLSWCVYAVVLSPQFRVPAATPVSGLFLFLPPC